MQRRSIAPRRRAQAALHSMMPHGVFKGDSLAVAQQALAEGTRLRRLLSGLRYSLRNGANGRNDVISELKRMVHPSPAKRSRSQDPTVAQPLTCGRPHMHQ